MPFFCAAQLPEITPTAGQIISKSCKIAHGEYHFDGAETGFENPVLTIKGENIEVDFQGATFFGNGKKALPDQFSGLGIKVEGKIISIKNLKVRGYKIGLLATQVVDFQLIDSDFSYNWRPRLKSTREKEDPADQLFFEPVSPFGGKNDHDEWMHSGAGIYLKNCPNALVKNCTATGNQNGLMLAGCDSGLFYNNNFRFNSGIGIGLFRSSKNRIMHNRLDWNVRGFSQNFYQTGQGSAGVLCFEKSKDNTIGYNSATHSGNGLIAWNDPNALKKPDENDSENLVAGNDFSYSLQNGMRFSNSGFLWISSNYMDECRHGISLEHHSGAEIFGNTTRKCGIGMALDDVQHIAINENEFQQDTVGIQILGKPETEAERAFAKEENIDIYDGKIFANKFIDTHNPLKINGPAEIELDSANQFSGHKTNFSIPVGSDSLSISWIKKGDNLIPIVAVWLPDGIDANGDITNRRGRHWIWMTEWGPYDFRGPICFLKKTDGPRYEFWMNAAGPGNWSVKKARGFKTLTMTGGFPTKLIAERNPAGGEIFLQFEAVFQNDQVDIFGNKIPAGQPYLFDYQPIK